MNNLGSGEDYLWTVPHVSLNNGKCIAGVFWNLTKAFDYINHELLFKKLGFYGIRCVLLNWMRSYVDDRKQRVHLQLLWSNKISNWHNVEHGVPQGSDLGPLLLSLYINDFLMLINNISDVNIFAVNTSLLITANSQDELLQRFNHVLNHMSKWFQANWLILNTTKTKVLIFTSAELPNAWSLMCVDHLLLEVETIKFLGLQLDNQITWKTHIQLLLRKLNSVCFLVIRLYSVLNIDSLELVNFADFHLIVKYGIIFWSNQHNVNTMFIFQKRILRIMLGLGYRSSCRSWFKQLDIITVPCLYIYSLVTFVIPLILKLIFLYILSIQGRKIIFINHWLNLHR